MATCNCSSNPCKCKGSLKEHLEKIKYKTHYMLKEASYNLVQDMDEDDNIPEEIWSSKPISEDGETTGDAATQEPKTPEMPEDQIAAGGQPTTDIPATPPPAAPVSTPPVGSAPMGDQSPIAPQKTADELQNDIIKTSVAAMQKMHQEMDRLNMTVDQLNMKIDGLNKEVEAVREPTNVEKLMSKKEDSHPFYYNLNDMWKGNWFQGRRDIDNSKGMVELEDGTYIADFDSLPKYSDREIKDSFNI